MSTKIRLARGGSKKRPFYSIVIADSAAPRDGKFIEKVGTYNPLLAKDSEQRVVLKQERIEYWASVGAVPSERVAKFLRDADIAQKFKSVQNANKKSAVAMAARVKNAEKKESEDK